MILTDDQIRAAIESGDISFEPFDDERIQPASIDLRVGGEGATTKHKQKINIAERGLIILEPGDFCVICILERVRFGPQYVGRLGLRSKFARKGLIATTGPQIDPGFEGSITLGLANLTPKSVPLAHRDDLLTLEIHKLEKPASKPYCGPYQGKYGLSTEDLDTIAEGDGMAFSEVLTTLRSLSANVGDLSSKMSELAGQMKTQQWVVPLIITVAFGVIALIVTLR